MYKTYGAKSGNVLQVKNTITDNKPQNNLSARFQNFIFRVEKLTDSNKRCLSPLKAIKVHL